MRDLYCTQRHFQYLSNAERLFKSIMYSAFEEIERILKHDIALPVEFIMHISPIGSKAKGWDRDKSIFNNYFSCV